MRGLDARCVMRPRVAMTRQPVPACEAELRHGHNRVAEVPGQTRANDRGHDQRPDGCAQPERRVHPIQDARAVRYCRIGIHARVDRPRTQAQDAGQRHHAQPRGRQRVAEQRDSGHGAADRQGLADTQPREHSTADGARDEIARRECAQEQPERVQRQSERGSNRRPGDAQHALGQAEAHETERCEPERNGATHSWRGSRHYW